jgi:aryl-alcohol dehydrogenase-like predicted oxidoreductase
MGKKREQSDTVINRRECLNLLAKGVAVGTGLFFSIPGVPSDLFNSDLNAAVLEWRNKKPTMGYRRLGKTNIMISEISFGCAINYGCNSVGSELTDSVRELYDRAVEAGINFFDTTANHTSGYTKEECFQHFRPVRDRVYLSTKVDDFEPKAVRTSIEKSLARMKTDYIDIVFLHNMMNRGGWRKGVEALEEIREMIHEGKVRFAGVSDHSYGNLMKIGDHKDIVDAILLKYSVKRRAKAETVIARAKSYDIGILAMKVFEGANERLQCRWQRYVLFLIIDTYLPRW